MTSRFVDPPGDRGKPVQPKLDSYFDQARFVTCLSVINPTEHDMSIMEIETSSQLLPTRAVCRRYGVSDRTVARWERDPDLQFPQPVTINKRKYYDASALTAFDRAQAAQR